MDEKKLLIEKIFQKGKRESGNTTKNGISFYLSLRIEDLFGYKIGEKTLVRYYDSYMIEGKDYNIPPAILDYLSKYLGYENYQKYISNNVVFNENYANGVHEVTYEKGFDDLADKISKIAIKIIVNPIIKLPEFITKNNHIGIIGVLVIGGFFLNEYFKNDKRELQIKSEKTTEKINANNEIPTTPLQWANFEKNENKSEQKIITEKTTMQCMFWNYDHFQKSFCGDFKGGKQLIAFDENTMLIKKITRPDTLTPENAMGKVWYDKTNGRVEFFTHYGIHPENGKTLKKVTTRILEKYALQ